MKKFTCREMGGPCDAVIEGATAEEAGQNGAAHVEKMAAQGDEAHVSVKAGMDSQGEEGKAMWWEEFNAKWEAKEEE